MVKGFWMQPLYIISLCDEKRYPNSLLRENTMWTRQSYYASPDIPALHLPLTKSITVAEGDKTFRPSFCREVGNVSAGWGHLHFISAFNNQMHLHFSMYIRANHKCMHVYPSNCILITICPERFVSPVHCRKVKASVHRLCVAYVPSCGLACLAVIMLWPASHCEMSSWILKRLSLHLYLTIVEWHITWATGPVKEKGQWLPEWKMLKRLKAVFCGQSYDWKRNICTYTLPHQPNNNKLLNHLKDWPMFIQECDSLQMALRDHLALLSASKS